MRQFLMGLWREEEGQNVPEYALLVLLICLTAVTTMGGMATKVNAMYNNASAHVAVAASNPVLTGGSAGYTTESPANPQSKMDNKRPSPNNQGH